MYIYVLHHIFHGVFSIVIRVFARVSTWNEGNSGPGRCEFEGRGFPWPWGYPDS